MTLKTKISLLTSALFSVLFGIAAAVVLVLFSNFRKEEFEGRLQKEAISSIKLLVNVKEVDNQVLKAIDQNTIHELLDEKTLIFDRHFKLIYSSIDDAKIDWTVNDLTYLKKNKSFFRKEGDYEVCGVVFEKNKKDYYALISATDGRGTRGLEYLIWILLTTYVVFTIACWFVTSYAVKKLLSPLDVFHNKIKVINENNLDTRIDVNSDNNEIDLIANEFNLMMKRIDQSYQKQKEFT